MRLWGVGGGRSFFQQWRKATNSPTSLITNANKSPAIRPGGLSS